MEVLVGPTYDMEVSATGTAASSSSSSNTCVRDRNTGVPPASTPPPAPTQSKDKVVTSSCLFLNDDEDDERGDHKTGKKFVSGHGSGDSPESSSSIGVAGDSDDDNENDEVSSYEGEELHRTKFSMDLFEENLPIKRGLSNHYSGKSKSFGNLSAVKTVKDLEKEEKPFNKRRRLLIASKLWSRNSFYSRHNPKSMPLLPILPDDDEEEVEEEEQEDEVLDGNEHHQHQTKH